MNILCFSQQLYSDKMWTNKQHVMSRLASQGHKIIYVDPMISWGKWGLHMLKRIHTLKHFLLFSNKINENLFVITPVKFFSSESHNLWLTKYLIKIFLKLKKFNPDVYWVYEIEFCNLLDSLDSKILVYDCVDSNFEFPASRYKYTKDELKNFDHKLTKNADVVFTTSLPLYEEKIKINKNTHYVGNAADFSHNNKALSPHTKIATELENIKSPVIGFQGNLSEYKQDFELLEYLLKRNPQLNFVFLGPEATIEREGKKVKHTHNLRKFKNAHFFGIIDYERLPNFYKGFDIAIMPLLQNDYNRSSFPIKFSEYLGSGLPVVCMYVESLRDFEGVEGLYFANSHEEFNKLVHQSLKKPKEKGLSKRIELAKEYSWEVKIEKMLKLLYPLL